MLGKTQNLPSAQIKDNTRNNYSDNYIMFIPLKEIDGTLSVIKILMFPLFNVKSSQSTKVLSIFKLRLVFEG